MVREFLERIGVVHKQPWIERHFTRILVISVAIFMALCLAIGLQQSVWFDEAYSILLAKQPLDQLLYLTSVDTHPPLYYLLLKAWASLFGWSELALRSLSVVAAGGAALFSGLLVKRMFGVKAALVMLPFIVFAPFLLRYGFEVRMYALASLIGIAATYVLVRALEAKNAQQRRLYALYAVLIALGVYTLYYTAVLWIAHVVWLLWLAGRQKQPLLKQPWLVALTGSVLLFIPWILTFVSQLGNGALAPISQPLTIDNLLGIVSFMFVYQPTWQLSALLSLVIVFVIAALVYFAVKAYSAASSKQKPYLMLLALYTGVPIAIIALVSLVRPMYVERYLAHVLIGASMFVGVCIWITLRRAGKKVWIVAGSLMLVMLLGVTHLAQVGNYNFQRLQFPAVKEIAGQLGDCQHDTMVLAADPYVAIELSYYLPDCDVRFYSQWPTLSGGYAPLSGSPLQVKDPATQLVSSRNISYVYYDHPQLQMPAHLRITTEQSIGALHVAVFSAE